MQPAEFDQPGFFRAIEQSGARALLIGRQALIVLGLPVLTKDYDFWIPSDDAALLNAALETFELYPNRSPEQAQKVGRYVLENDERVDVLVARRMTTVDGIQLTFDDAWQRRVQIPLTDGVHVTIPSIDDLILTKRFAARPKDAEDVRLLEVLRSKG